MEAEEKDTRRVVITGMGAVTPLGTEVDTYWEGVLAGESGVDYITLFDTSDCPGKIAAEVKDFDPRDYMDAREARRTSRFIQFATISARKALEDARLDLSKEDATRVGLEIGSAAGGIGIVEEQACVLKERGARRIQPTVVPSVLISMAPCQMAISLGIKGPASSPVAACATGVVAVGEAMRRLQRGDVDVMVAGASESIGSPLTVTALARLGALSPNDKDPAGACRPFDLNRDGFVLGEGAAVVVMETLKHALNRGARILGEVLGYGFTTDGYHLAAPDPTGNGAARAMDLAISDSRLAPTDIDHIISHGTGTKLNDVAETKAIRTVFGETAYKIPINSIKSMIGHLLGAAGAISFVTALKSIQDNIIPPTINLHNPDPECDLDYVPLVARLKQIDTVLVNALGLGGQNAALVVRGFSELLA
ncbi:MAG: beta-ketoacyl-ACP synthase II [Anaerolineae bacterium]|nr:beta-ketoacyl-ACP synthase II [Anaerolineae bacterium]NIN98638.1 beta-ketoacyl-ACP synthase II [Anaerolineae bacterium]NIQ81525.1 beta-ketoacyl-ACP synthase II [Anaerolineae bacterium]